METRLATLAQAPLLVALHRESFGEASWSLRQISESLRLDTTAAILAESAGAAAGFILCQIIPATEAEILTLCVTPSFRRQGLGALLLKKGIEKARQQNAKRLFLEVAADNDAARSLYEKSGFCALNRRAGYYEHKGHPVDAVTLCLNL